MPEERRLAVVSAKLTGCGRFIQVGVVIAIS
jgi:hypothetical protein